MAIFALAAKTDPNDEHLWLPLTFHLEDTARVMEYLLTNWLPESYYRCLGLDREAFFALAIAAALFHDIGKSTKLFQHQITRLRPELQARLQRFGLEAEFTQSLKPKNVPHAAAGAELLRYEGFGDSLAAIVGAHHGTPETQRNTYYWEDCPSSFGWTDNSKPDTAWGAVQKELIAWAAAQTAESLPECTMMAQMALTGLAIMADWIASNTAYFPLISTDEMPQAYDPNRAVRAFQALRLPKPWCISEDWKTADYFDRRFGFPANSIQKRVEQIAANMQTPGVLILEAPMGQGKTEAALAAAEIMMNRFHLSGAAFFLPSQATSNAMLVRMMHWAQHQPDALRVAVELAHGQADLNPDFLQLAEGRVQIAQGEQQADPLTVHSFFHGRKTRLLANLVVGTVDQLLMAALKQRHVMLRHLGLTGKVVIIDECHAYDTYMNTYLDRVLDWLGAYQVPVILLSATLPGTRRAALLRAYLGKKLPAKLGIEKSQAYPLLCWTEGEEPHMESMPPEGASRSVAIQKVEESQALDAVAEAQAQGCAGIIVNTVKRAQTLRTLLQNRCPDAVVLLDHSSFLAQDRLDREQEILERVGKHSTAQQRKGVLVIGTQVLEQSLDLDFDLLVTDLCPMDLLLQRIGRLHRHPRPRPSALETPRCLVMGALGDLDDASSHIYGDYYLLRSRAFLPDVIRLPEDISPLVQKTYNPDPESPEPDNACKEAKTKQQLTEENQEKNAKAYRLDQPSRDGFFDTIEGLLDNVPGLTEPQAQAAVRDGTAPIEVLVVQRAEDGFVTLLSGPQKGSQYRTDTQPSTDEARAIAAQRLRLPARFSKHYRANANEVIAELEAQTNRYLPLWTQSPLLAGSLFLILNQDGTAELAGEQLQYDSIIGLIAIEREVSNGRN